MNQADRNEYPFASHFIDINGHRYHYIDEGSGEPVVMVHGNPTWSYYFRNVVKELRKNHRVIVPDHIGCGYSDKPSQSDYDYILKNRIGDLQFLLDALDIKSSITLIVHDWGGMIGMGYAVKFPDRIKRIVLTNTAAFHLPKEKKLPFSIALARNTPFGPFLIRGLNAFSRGANYFCVTKRKMAGNIKKDYLVPYNTWGNRLAVYRFIKDIPLKPEDESYELVSEIEDGLVKFKTTPVLICWGQKDFVFDRHFLYRWKNFFPQAEIHCFDESGHYLLEDDGDSVIPIIKKFMLHQNHCSEMC
ncbi:MAG: alpha/beta fold hydrolase [Bdellovibrionota bacterium]